MPADPYRDSIHIAADPAIVFDYFTTPDALARWLGDRAILEPHPGGRFTVFFGDRAVEGRYLELDPPRRLVISWGRRGSVAFPPALSVLEVTLSPEGGGTRVAIVHSGLPESEAPRHALGWRHYLPRLAVAAAGGQPAPHHVPEALTRGLEDESSTVLGRGPAPHAGAQ
jgi:uncharacterized protein YndB with AHSA1/START domain